MNAQIRLIIPMINPAVEFFWFLLIPIAPKIIPNTPNKKGKTRGKKKSTPKRGEEK